MRLTSFTDFALRALMRLGADPDRVATTDVSAPMAAPAASGLSDLSGVSAKVLNTARALKLVN
jgi:hypothetical protein